MPYFYEIKRGIDGLGANIGTTLCLFVVGCACSGSVTKPDSLGFKVTNIFGSKCAARPKLVQQQHRFVQSAFFSIIPCFAFTNASPPPIVLVLVVFHTGATSSKV